MILKASPTSSNFGEQTHKKCTPKASPNSVSFRVATVAPLKKRAL